MAYEHEIPKELEEGEVYSSKTVRYLVAFNKSITVICEDTNNFMDTDSVKYEVIKKIEAYMIQNVNGAIHVKNSKDIIYMVKRVH